jgi:hypothetical protein
LRRTWRFVRSCLNDGSRVLERLQSGDEFVQVGIAVAVESAHGERPLHFYRSPIAAVEHFSSGSAHGLIGRLGIAEGADQTGEREMREVSSPQCDRPRVNQLDAGHRRDWKLALSSSSWTSTAPVGVSGVRGHNRNRFIDSRVKFQVTPKLTILQ